MTRPHPSPARFPGPAGGGCRPRRALLAAAPAALLVLLGCATACAPAPTPSDHPVIVRTGSPPTPFVTVSPTQDTP